MPGPAIEAPSTQRGHRVATCLRPPGQGLHLQAVQTGDPGRAELEDYVQAAFQARHGATVRTFMPTLVAFRDRQGAVRGVAGLRGADQGRLFLEQYLEQPVEQALAAALARIDPLGAAFADPIERHQVVEVGHLAGSSCRAAVRVVAQLPAFLRARHYTWIVFTATNALRDILESLGAPLVELARADGAAVAARHEWGRYYDTDPRVCAGFLPDADRLACFAPLRGGRH